MFLLLGDAWSKQPTGQWMLDVLTLVRLERLRMLKLSGLVHCLGAC